MSGNEKQNYRAELELAIRTLRAHARLCDQWAQQSQKGGWSTHQVDQNRNAANELRRKADELELAIEEELGTGANKPAGE